ncbi:MAG: hypothetical protein LBT01_08410 [Spirochaetaceae bacterium]|jgi:hypothetical protein|nr:hypothetical protein [Spirochaetaceae bacterium]
MRKEMKMKLLVCTAFTVLAFASCNAIADTSGLSITPETVWLSLTATKAELVNGVNTATLTLDFDKAIDGLTDNLTAADLEKIFTFSDEDPSFDTLNIKPLSVKKSVVGIYTLTVINTPETTECMVLVKINQTGVTPTTRPWFLDGLPKAQNAAVAAGGDATFTAVAKDADGNSYAVGAHLGTNALIYGDKASATGSDANSNAVIVKYNVSGTALWAKVLPPPDGNYATTFDGVALDGNKVYAVGGEHSGPKTAILVQYNSDTGEMQWIKTASAGSDASNFSGVAVDSSSKVYAVGYQTGNGSFTYGSSVSVSGSSTNSMNAVIVQYDSAGAAQWARSVSVTGGDSEAAADSVFIGVAADGSGVYAAGRQFGTTSYGYGGSASVAGSATSEVNAVLVRYNSAGAAQWARSVSGINAQSEFQNVATDGAGKVYAVGIQAGDGAFSYGANTSATGTYAGGSAVIVLYDSSGAAQWAKSVNSNAQSSFISAALDGSGNVYVAGCQYGSEEFDYGDAKAQGDSAVNAVVVRYNGINGEAQWAQSSNGGQVMFSGIAADKTGGFTTVGAQAGTLNYGNGVSAEGSLGHQHPVIVWYK